MRKLKAIDLFAGCGGLSLGLRNAGFSIRCATDIDLHASLSYRKNIKRVPFLVKDIREVTGDILLEASGGHVDLLAGCAPCQGFSSLTAKLKREDPRNELILEMARLVEEIKPTCVMMENVPGLVSRGEAMFKEFTSRLVNLGYVIHWKVVQMADYGVPQSRRRLVMTAGRGFAVPLPNETHARLPTKEKLPWLTLSDAVAGQPTPKKLSEIHSKGLSPTDVNWHVVRDIKPQTQARLDAAIPGRPWLDVDESIRPKCHQGNYKGFTNVYGRMSWDQLPGTITTGCTTPARGRFGHPDPKRTTISVREAATLQTFPTSYNFETEYMEKACEMIGNAVPPLFSELLGRSVLKAFRENYER